MSPAGQDWVALLPAAKTTVPGGDGPRWRDVWDEDPMLARPRRDVARALVAAARELDEAAWGRLVEGRGEVAAGARRVAKGIRTAPCRPAGERYAGPVAARLDAPTLPAAARRRVLFVTATAGLVASDAPMPDERLPIGATLPPLGRLAPWWRPHVQAALARRLAPGAVVWDLLGGEYAAAVVVPAGCRRVTVRFESGGRGAPSATAKQLRGLAARWLAEHGGADPAVGLEGFAAEVAGRGGASQGPMWVLRVEWCGSPARPERRHAGPVRGPRCTTRASACGKLPFGCGRVVESRALWLRMTDAITTSCGAGCGLPPTGCVAARSRTRKTSLTRRPPHGCNHTVVVFHGGARRPS